ncbi:hypothetical protein [Stenotrophomonas sp.]|uniref:hypothetical protein n=1 Tax=Stenotrophomonas sp. TaxID=69392 RepID=UPI00289CFD4D|nr:hypothetical protein [Stenotrophomonas sp.]
MKGFRIAAQAVVVVVCTVFGVGAQDLVPPMEYSKFLKSAEMVGPLGRLHREHHQHDHRWHLPAFGAGGCLQRTRLVLGMV